MLDNPTTEATTRNDQVIKAFSALIEALGWAALAHQDDFERASAFRRRAVDLSVRWHEGRPAATPRGAAKAEG